MWSEHVSWRALALWVKQDPLLLQISISAISQFFISWFVRILLEFVTILQQNPKPNLSPDIRTCLYYHVYHHNGGTISALAPSSPDGSNCSQLLRTKRKLLRKHGWCIKIVHLCRFVFFKLENTLKMK